MKLISIEIFCNTTPSNTNGAERYDVLKLDAKKKHSCDEHFNKNFRYYIFRYSSQQQQKNEKITLDIWVMDTKRFYIFNVNLAIFEFDSDRKLFASLQHISLFFIQNDELAVF